MLAMAPIPKPILPEVLSDPVDPVFEIDASNAMPPRVLVHCRMGISRSATVVIAYLMRKTGKPLDEVLQDVQGKRKIKPNPNFMAQLRVWGDVAYHVWDDEDRSVPKEPYRLYLGVRAAKLKKKGLTGDEPTWPQMPPPSLADISALEQRDDTSG